MERRCNGYREPEMTPLGIIDGGVRAIVSTTANPMPQQEIIFYREIGRTILQVLPPTVSTLRITNGVAVTRSGAEPGETWTLAQVEQHATRLAHDSGGIYNRKLRKEHTKLHLE